MSIYKNGSYQSSAKISIIFRVFMYYFLFHRASSVILLYNPCKTKGKDGCADGHFCCSHCEYISDTGCITKSLGCRIGLCSVAKNTNEEATKKMKVIYDLKRRFLGEGLVFRGNCADMLHNLRATEARPRKTGGYNNGL